MLLKKGTMRSARGGSSVEKPLVTQRRKSSSTRRLEVSATLNTRYSAATMPIRLCHMNFSRERMPSGSLRTTLRQSSTQPMAPKPKVTSITTQTKRFVQSNHSSVDTPMPISTSTPPMVGVLRFSRWACTPYSRIGWPIFISVRRRMTQGPKARPMSSEVSAASTARKVRYWKTRRKPRSSGYSASSHCVRLSSIAGLTLVRRLQRLHHPLHLHEA